VNWFEKNALTLKRLQMSPCVNGFTCSTGACFQYDELDQNELSIS